MSVLKTQQSIIVIAIIRNECSE